MNTVAGIGDDSALDGFALAGVTVHSADTDFESTAAWENLDDAVGLVILSARAAQVLDVVLAQCPDRLTVVMP
jgi:vacuolar-type H+-ATPase subunit F/Vma7